MLMPERIDELARESTPDAMKRGLSGPWAQQMFIAFARAIERECSAARSSSPVESRGVVAWMHPMTGAVVRAAQKIPGVTLDGFDIPLVRAHHEPSWQRGYTSGYNDGVQDEKRSTALSHASTQPASDAAPVGVVSEREAFDKWFSAQQTSLMNIESAMRCAWHAALASAPASMDRAAVIEECAKVLDETWFKSQADCTAAIRALATASAAGKPGAGWKRLVEGREYE